MLATSETIKHKSQYAVPYGVHFFYYYINQYNFQIGLKIKTSRTIVIL